MPDDSGMEKYHYWNNRLVSWEMQELFPRLPCSWNSKTSRFKQAQEILDLTTLGLVYPFYCAFKELLVLMFLLHEAVGGDTTSQKLN